MDKTINYKDASKFFFLTYHDNTISYYDIILKYFFVNKKILSKLKILLLFLGEFQLIAFLKTFNG